MPLAALAGETALEAINLSENEDLQVERSISSLLAALPRLRGVKIGKSRGAWSSRSATNLVAFAAEMGARSFLRGRPMVSDLGDNEEREGEDEDENKNENESESESESE